ncbi:MAG: periplasmic heavy metal sensor [Caulobacteraceae bacterium]
MSNRWLIIGLVVSAAINVFLIGTAVGVLVLGARFAQAGPNTAPRPGQEIIRAAAVLPPEQAQKIRQALRREAVEVQPQVRASRQARRQAWLNGASEPFDAAAVKAALAQARERDIATRARIENEVVDLAADLTPEQRRAYFRAIARPPPPPGFWRRRGLMGPPGMDRPGMSGPRPDLRMYPAPPPENAGPPPPPGAEAPPPGAADPAAP